jgi:hypothetical protein
MSDMRVSRQVAFRYRRGLADLTSSILDFMADCVHDIAMPYHDASDADHNVADDLLSLGSAKAEIFAIAVEFSERAGFKVIAPSTLRCPRERIR